MIGPSLHHHATLRDIRGVVVRSRDCISFLVSQLQLDVRVRETHLTKERGRNAAEPMAGHSVLVSKALKRFEDGVVRHRPLVITLARKDMGREIS